MTNDFNRPNAANTPPAKSSSEDHVGCNRTSGRHRRPGGDLLAKGCIRSHGIRAKRDGTGNRTRGPGNTACLAGHASGRDATGSRSRDQTPAPATPAPATPAPATPASRTRSKSRINRRRGKARRFRRAFSCEAVFQARPMLAPGVSSGRLSAPGACCHRGHCPSGARPWPARWRYWRRKTGQASR